MISQVIGMQMIRMQMIGEQMIGVDDRGWPSYSSPESPDMYAAEIIAGTQEVTLFAVEGDTRDTRAVMKGRLGPSLRGSSCSGRGAPRTTGSLAFVTLRGRSSPSIRPIV